MRWEGIKMLTPDTIIVILDDSLADVILTAGIVYGCMGLLCGIVMLSLIFELPSKLWYTFGNLCTNLKNKWR